MFENRKWHKHTTESPKINERNHSYSAWAQILESNIDVSHTGVALGCCYHIRTIQFKPGLKQPHLKSVLIPVSAFTGNDFDVSFFLLHRDVLFLKEETKAFALPSYPHQKHRNFIKHLVLSVSQDSYLVTDWTLMVQLIKLMAIS